MRNLPVHILIALLVIAHHPIYHHSHTNFIGQSGRSLANWPSIAFSDLRALLEEDFELQVPREAQNQN